MLLPVHAIVDILVSFVSSIHCWVILANIECLFKEAFTLLVVTISGISL